MILADANMVLRLLLGDDAEQTARADAIARAHRLFIPATVLLECVWVLQTRLTASAPIISDLLRNLAAVDTISIEGADQLDIALEQYQAGWDFADAWHLAPHAAHVDGVATFDKKFGCAVEALGLRWER
jgi:predicted nucleic-acid-binding protein